MDNNYTIDMSSLSNDTDIITSNANVNISDEIASQVAHYHEVGRAMRLYVTPIIIFGGTIGNILTIIVVLSRHFRHSPTSIPFISLATVDIGVLYFNLLDIWLGALTDGGSLQYARNISAAGCKISSFLTIFLTHCSSWILVLINVERVVSVWSPLKARTFCTGRRIAGGLAVLLVLLAGISVHLFWTTQYNGDNPAGERCNYDEELLGGQTGQLAWLTVDATLFSFLPFVLILSSNIIICASLARARRKHKRGGDSAKSITFMLLTISIVFLIATTPLTICYQFHDTLLAHFSDKPVEEALWYDLVINTILVLLCYSSNAVNFLLYCVSGSKFRQALREVCRCSQSNHHRGHQKLQPHQLTQMYSVNTNGGGYDSAMLPSRTSTSRVCTTFTNIEPNQHAGMRSSHEDWRHVDSEMRELEEET